MPSAISLAERLNGRRRGQGAASSCFRTNRTGGCASMAADFGSPAAVYPWTLIAYSYGKVLLAPGQRLGYLATSPLMPAAEREALQGSMFGAQMTLGW
jgi:hypothetical protein